MVSAFLTPDLMLLLYNGSPASFLLVPSQDGGPIADLAAYDQIDFSVFTGTRTRPGTKILPITYTGLGPNYITVENYTPPGSLVVFPSIRVTLPGTAVTKELIPPGQYYAELWLTPPVAERIFTNWAILNFEPTTA